MLRGGAFSAVLTIICLAPLMGSVRLMDVEPGPGWRYGDIVDCYVTAYSTEPGGIDSSSARYRVSNSGDDLTSFSPWRTEGIEAAEGEQGETRFSVRIPNSEGDRFHAGEDNYIEWYVEDHSGSRSSSLNRIRILDNFIPGIAISQPVGDGAGLKPLIEVKVLSYALGIDAESIIIDVKEHISGKNVLNISGEEEPGIFDAEESVIRYQSGDAVFENGVSYELTVRASDKGYVQPKTAEQTALFTAAEGMISDFVNYPNPFDSRSEGTSFRYVLRDDSRVTINIYDSSRSLVKEIVRDAFRLSGVNEEIWDGRDFAGNYVANGVYFSEIIAESGGRAKRYTVTAVHSR